MAHIRLTVARRQASIACFFVVGVMVLMITTTPPYPVAVAAMFLMGISGGPLNPILMSNRQERVPLSHRARVFGTTTAIAFVAIPLGQLLGGFMIEWLGPRFVIAIVAVIYLAVVGSFLVNPVLDEMDQKPAAPVSASPAA